MKEYPEPNYLLHVSLAGVSIDPALMEHVPRTYRVGVNPLVEVIVIPWLRGTPWPPPYPTDWDHWKDRDEAAQYLFATNDVSIAPTDERGAWSQTVVFPEYPETAQTVFWLPRADFESLLEEVERIHTSAHHGEVRLDELGEDRSARSSGPSCGRRP